MDTLMRLAVMVRLRDMLTGPAGRLAGGLDRIREAAAAAGQAVGGVAAHQDAMGRNVPEQKGMFDGIGKKAMLAGAGMTAASFGLGKAIAGALGPLQTLEDALAAAKTVWTETTLSKDDSILALKESALAWSKAHGDSAESFVKTSYLLGSAGLNHEQALSGTQTALTLAKATMGNAEEAGDLLATLYNTMGDKSADAATELARLGDQVAKTQAVFQIANLNGLASGLSYAIPAAKQMGVSLEQTLAILGQFNNAGLKGSMAGTAFASTMSQMIEASDKLGFKLAKTATGGLDVIRTVESIRKRFGDLNDMPDALKLELQKGFGGSEAFRAIALLMEQTKAVKLQTKDIAGAAGTAAAQAEIMEGTSSASLQKLKAQWVSLQIQFAETLLPHLPPLIARAKELLTALGEYLKDNPGFGKLVLDTTLWLGVLGPVIAAVGGLIDIVGAVGGAVGALGPVFRLIATIASVSFAGIHAALVGLGTLIMAHPMLAIGALLMAGVGIVIAYWDDLKGYASAAADAVVSIWHAAGELISGVFGAAVDGAGALLAMILPQWMADTFTTIWTYLGQIFGELADAFEAWGGKMWEAFIDGLIAAFKASKDFVTDLFSPEKWVGNISKITDAITGVMSAVEKVSVAPTLRPAGMMARPSAAQTLLRGQSGIRALGGERALSAGRAPEPVRAPAQVVRVVVDDARLGRGGEGKEKPTVSIQNLNLTAKDAPGLADQLTKMARTSG